MSKHPQPIFWDTWDRERVHRETVLRKVQKIDGLRALVEMHEADPDHDHEYVVGLRARLRSTINQLNAMSS